MYGTRAATITLPIVSKTKYMQITFLGTGTSQGVPIILQPPNLCDTNDPRNWRTRCSVHVMMGDEHIQVDAAQEFRLQCIWYDIPQVDHFILTHGHADHILGMDDLRRYCDLRDGNALPVYGTTEGLERVQTIFPYAICDRPRVSGYPAFRLCKMPEKLSLPGGDVYAIPLPHGSIEVLGLVFVEKNTGKKFSYFTDCSEVPERARELAAGSDLLVLDGLRQKEHPSHMTIEKAAQTALEIGAKQSFLTHMTCTVDYKQVQASLPEGVALAYDGLKIELDKASS